MKTITFRNRCLAWGRLLGVGILGLGAPLVSHANVWTNGAGDYNWNNASNWTGGIPDTTGEFAQIDVNSSLANPVSYSTGIQTDISQLALSTGVSNVSALSITGAGSVLNMTVKVDIGRTGTGTVTVGTGATLSTTGSIDVNVGVNSGSTGTIILSGGTVLAGSSAGFYYNGKVSGANATTRGYGTVTAISAGGIVNNGKIIADGGGVDRTLTLAVSGATANVVQNTVANTSDMGYYAVNHGKVTFHSAFLSTGGVYTWGDTQGFAMVNSARLTLGTSTNAIIAGSLLALDRTDIFAVNGAATGDQFVGYWDFAQTAGLSNGFSKVEFRYDDTALLTLGASESDLALYYYDTTSSLWTAVSGTIDQSLNTFSSNTGTYKYGNYALGVTAAVPEPSTVALLIGATCLLVLRWRRSGESSL